MDFLSQQTKVLYGETILDQIKATGKDVVVGGGDTGSDCIGTSTDTNKLLIEQVGQPHGHIGIAIKTSSSHEEGCDRNWLINKEFIANEQGVLVGLKTVDSMENDNRK
jgi:glutamate synthase (NADPH/NADH) small chain